jgi:hypothetical protein
MSVLMSWVVTMVVFAGIFVIGVLLQRYEKRQRITRKAAEAIHQEMARAAYAGGVGHIGWEGSTVLGTLYGRPTEYERRKAGR